MTGNEDPGVWFEHAGKIGNVIIHPSRDKSGAAVDTLATTPGMRCLRAVAMVPNRQASHGKMDSQLRQLLRSVKRLLPIWRGRTIADSKFLQMFVASGSNCRLAPKGRSGSLNIQDPCRCRWGSHWKPGLPQLCSLSVPANSRASDPLFGPEPAPNFCGS